MAEASNNGEGEQQNVARSIREVQQSFAESLGFGDRIIWDLLSDEQAHILKEKLKALIRDPEVAEDEATSTLSAKQKAEKEAAEKKVKKQCAANETIREILFNSVWDQRKYTNRQSLTTIFYVLVATEETDHNIAQDSKSWSCHPVFRARRCIKSAAANDNRNNAERRNNSSDCCMIFIDENGRVYQNWNSYVAENELPAGIMVAPRRGVYNLCARGDVQLESWMTPAGTPHRKMLGMLDMTGAIGGFAAACVPVAAFFTLPVAAPVMAAAGIVGLASAGYATARSGAQLVDRSQHEQSINVTNRTARNHWISVLAGAVGLGAAGATKALTVATSAGREVGAITQLTVNGMNISSIMISGSGLTNGVIEFALKYNDGDDISAMDKLQLSASLVLFTNSVYNFKLASTIISETSNAKIGSFRETMSNRQRRMFDKLTKETIRTRGATKGKIDVIRNVNEMPSRQEFNDLYKINKQLNQKGIRPTFAAEGSSIVLNEQVVTNGAELRASVQHNLGPDILGQVTQPIPESYKGAVGGINGRGFAGTTRLIGPNPTSLESTDAKNNNYALGVDALRCSSIMINGVLLVLKNYGSSIFEHIINAESFENALLSLADNMNDDVLSYVLNLTQTFMDTMCDELETVLQFYITSESVLYRLGKQILDNYRGYTLMQISESTIQILNAVRDYFLSLNPNCYPELLTKCNVCDGYYNICNL